MATLYTAHNNTPVFKFRSSPSATTAVAAWTPATSTRIVLTDVMVANASYAPGTLQLRFGNVGGQVVADFALLGSTSIHCIFDSPKQSGTYDQALFMETSISGVFSVASGGFELE